MTRTDPMPDDSATYPGSEFLRRVRSAAMSVLGESDAGREVLELCDQHAEARRLICDDRSRGLTVVAVVGATGQGKSWLIRQFVRQTSIANSIRSGDNHDQATEKLLWIGPFPPADMDTRFEQFIACPAGEMQSIDAPYLLVDSPGSTDDRPAIAAAARRALSLASVLLLVVRRDQLRSETITLTTEASEGTVVIPVVNAIRDNDQLGADIEAFVSRMRRAAPTSQIAPAVQIPDFDVDQRGEEAIGKDAAKQIASSLQEILAQSWEGDRRRSTRLAAIDARFRSVLHSNLCGHLPDLTNAVAVLHREAGALPGEIAESLIGNSGSLRAAVRSSLRLDFLTKTAAFWFPYRSQLGLLNLTHGAWDRVLLSLSGSLPSLIGTVWTSTRNLVSDRDAHQNVRQGLRDRSAAAVSDRLGPLAINFRREVMRLRQPGESPVESQLDPAGSDQVASLSGIDTLQEKSQGIFEQEVEQVALSSAVAFVCGLVGTMIFWSFMAGPIVALYRSYLSASYSALGQASGDLSQFPHPEFSMMLTSFLLSILPTSVFAMIVLSIAQSGNRVRQAESAIRERHRKMIHDLQSGGVLRLKWDEPLLADAEFLLSIGIQPDSPEAA